MNAQQLAIQTQREFAQNFRRALQNRMMTTKCAAAVCVSDIRDEAEDQNDFPEMELFALRAAARSAWRKVRRNQIKQDGRRWCLRHDALFYDSISLPF